MRIESETYYVMDSREDWNHPMFEGAAFEKYYRYKEQDNGGIIIMGFKRHGESDYIELETPWDWLPPDLKDSRSICPSYLMEIKPF